MSRSGKVNPVSILLLLAAVGGGWWMFTYLPIHWDHLSVREAVDSAAAEYLVAGEDTAKRKLLARLNRLTAGGETIGWHFETDEEGNEERVPGLGLTEDNVTIEWDEANKQVTVRVEYDRVVELKPLEDRKTVHFSAEKSLVWK